MDRKLLIRVAAPTVVIGTLLCAACLVSAWFINQSQVRVSRILSDNVATLQTAQDMHITLRKLHFHCFTFLVDPDDAVLKEVEKIDREFRGQLGQAGRSATTPEEQVYLEKIRAGYDKYRKEFQRLKKEAACAGPKRNYHELREANPIRHIVEPCEGLMRVNEETMQHNAEKGRRVSSLLGGGMLLLGVGGPLSGLIIGFGVARGLSRSIARLSVRVHDMAQHLEKEVGSVTVATEGDIEALDERMRQIVQRVEEVTHDMQEHHRQMFRAQQLSAVGQLAASMAHEIRNPLTSMKMLVESALRAGKKPNGPVLPKVYLDDLTVIHGEIRRLEKTVQNVLDFSRLPTPQRTPCDLRQVVARAAELVKARARQQGTELGVRWPSAEVRAEADASQLCTVLVNLLINALDALKRGGRIEVCLRGSSRGDATITVVDSGPGIPGVMADRLFTPFASTKPTGTGLGLCISRRIVEEHGGRMEASNRSRGGGACLTVTLPTARKELRHAVTAGH
jgi:two-component system, NtrC family, sensor histidine kinase HydH